MQIYIAIQIYFKEKSTILIQVWLKCCIFLGTKEKLKLKSAPFIFGRELKEEFSKAFDSKTFVIVAIGGGETSLLKST